MSIPSPPQKKTQAIGALESKATALARGKELKEAAYDVLVLSALR